jgi:hypothetical protein
MTVRYIRLYSDNGGETHFADTELALDEIDYRPPAPLLFVSHAYAAGGLQFIKLPGGWTGEVHVPKRQFLICLDGHLEVTASDGEKRSFGPGACVLMEDVDGKGHRSNVRSGHDCVAAVVPID